MLIALASCGPKSEPLSPSTESELQTPEVAQPAASAPAKRQSAREVAEKRPKMNAQAATAYQAGMRAFSSGDLKGAEAQLTQAINADPRAYQAHYALGATFERLGDSSRAVAEHERALEILPDYEPSITAISTLYLRQGRAAEAQSFLSRQQTRAPNSAAILACMAEIKSVQKDSVQAQALAQQALKKDPDYRPAMVVLARDHYRNRRLDLALYTLTAILDGYGSENPPRDKNNAEARLIRGLIYKEQLRRNQAISEFQRAVELRPDLVEARLNLAGYMLEAGNADGAVPLLEGALAYEPANPLIHLNLGDAYRLQGRAKDALTQLDWVSQAAPKQAETYYDIGLVYLFGKVESVTPEQALDRALGAFEQFAKLEPNPKPGAGDDAQELIARAKNKKAVLEAMKESNAAAAQSEANPSSGDMSAPPAQGKAAANNPAPSGTSSAKTPTGAAPTGAAPTGAAPTGAAPTASSPSTAAPAPSKPPKQLAPGDFGAP
jgi:tetratricopeptide (TPR) repeat protein